MTMFNIKDYGLTSNQLQVRYETWDYHPAYRTQDWRVDVARGNTRSGYWDWVRGRLVEEQEELDRDSPYHVELEDL